MKIPFLSVFLFFACLYILSTGRGFYSSDGDVMFKTTAALVERHTFALERDPGLPQIIRGQNGQFYSKYDPGLPLLAAPLYVAGDWIGQINHAHRYRLAATFVLVVPALAAAGTLTALAKTAFAAGAHSHTPLPGGASPAPTEYIERNAAIWVLLAAGLATPLWYYARVLFAESVLACALTVTVLVIISTGSFREDVLPYAPTAKSILAGIIFGSGILTRAALAIYLPALLWLIVRQNSTRRPREIGTRLIAFGIGMLPFAAALLWYNNQRFGDPFRFGYAGEGFTTPPWEGAFGLLFSPGKSVFLYAPPLMLSLILWPRFRRTYPAAGGFLALAWATALPFYGAWWAWHGGWSWGPRFLVPLIPLSCLPLLMLPDTRRWRGIAAGLIAAGIVIQAAGVLTDPTPHYAALTQNGTTDYAALDYRLGQTPQAAAMRRVIHGQTEPLAMFHLTGTGLPPTWTIGVPVLLIAGMLFSAGTWGRIKKQRIRR